MTAATATATRPQAQRAVSDIAVITRQNLLRNIRLPSARGE